MIELLVEVLRGAISQRLIAEIYVWRNAQHIFWEFGRVEKEEETFRYIFAENAF